ncbi:MAG: hypothetical protein ACLP9L_29690 [Thermoguttaceae bacterium]
MSFDWNIFQEALFLGCLLGCFVGGCSGLVTGVAIAVMRQGRDRGVCLSAICGIAVGVVVATLYAILAAILGTFTGKGYRFEAWLEKPLETAAIVVVCVLSAYCSTLIVTTAQTYDHDVGRPQPRPEFDANTDQSQNPPAADKPGG